jgi:hypothetical protein
VSNREAKESITTVKVQLCANVGAMVFDRSDTDVVNLYSDEAHPEIEGLRLQKSGWPSRC